MAHDFCVFLAARFSDQKCGFKNKAKILTFSAVCRYEDIFAVGRQNCRGFSKLRTWAVKQKKI